MIRHLSHGDLEALNLQAQDITAMLERLIAGAANGTVFAAPKAAFSTPDGRYIMATLAAMDDPPFVATKSLVLNKENSLIGLPQINALVTLLDGQTGVPLATMDGNWVTGIRTAGLSALAAKYLARTDAKSIGFVGTGVQARSHLALFRQMFPLEHVKISGRGQANIDALAQAAAPLEVTICATPEQAIRDSDIVVTSVTHTGVAAPFLDARWLAPGSFAAVVDLAVPWHKSSFGALDRVILDDLAQEATMPEKLADPAHVHGDLSKLATDARLARHDPSERTAFVFRGHALGDLALAALAYMAAQ